MNHIFEFRSLDRWPGTFSPNAPFPVGTIAAMSPAHRKPWCVFLFGARDMKVGLFHQLFVANGLKLLTNGLKPPTNDCSYNCRSVVYEVEIGGLCLELCMKKISSGNIPTMVGKQL